MKRNLSRRQLIQAAAATAGTGLLLGPDGQLIRSAAAQAADKSAVVVIFLRGGFNALFNSTDSFRATGTYSVNDAAMRVLGGVNNLVVDASTFGTMPAAALANIASVGVNHRSSSHDSAPQLQWLTGTRSFPLMLASAMGGPSAVKAAVVGNTMPPGNPAPEGGVSLQRITDMSATIAALGGGVVDPAIPARPIAAAALINARNMSADGFAASPNSMKGMRESYDSAVNLVSAPVQTFNVATIAQAYGLGANTTAVNSFASQMLAAELMILSGTNVVGALTGFDWDSHGDTSGTGVRNRMRTAILPALNTFLTRMMTAPGRNVTTVILGDFARSLPGSDHAGGTMATVIGKKVRVGTTGRLTVSSGNNGPSFPVGTPPATGLWSYLATVSQSPTNPFGANPHTALVIP